MLSTFLVRLGLPLALKFSVYQPSFYQKSFEEETVVLMMASEFLTLILTFLKKNLQLSLLQGRPMCQAVAFVKLSEIPACFMMLIFGKFQSRVRLCSHGVLNKSTFYHHVEILTQVLLVKHLLLTGRSDFICTTECCFQWHMHRKILYVYHVTWENLRGEGCMMQRKEKKSKPSTPGFSPKSARDIWCDMGA